MYSKNGIPWVRPPTQDRKHRSGGSITEDGFRTGTWGAEGNDQDTCTLRW